MVFLGQLVTKAHSCIVPLMHQLAYARFTLIGPGPPTCRYRNVYCTQAAPLATAGVIGRRFPFWARCDERNVVFSHYEKMSADRHLP